MFIEDIYIVSRLEIAQSWGKWGDREITAKGNRVLFDIMKMF